MSGADQISLPGLAAPRPTHRLLLVLKPPTETAARLFERARGFRRAAGLSGPQVGAERLHFTLYWYGDYAGPPPASMVSAAREAASLVKTAPFQVTVDRLMSFDASEGLAPV